MAASIINILIPMFKTQQGSTFGSNNSNHPKKSQAAILTLTLAATRKSTTACKASETNTSSLSSTATQFETQNGESLKPNLGVADGVAEKWLKLHGEDDWVGLIDPMDPLMRSELIRYGEMAQACYDGFDFDPYSKYCGSCRFPLPQFLESLGLSHLGYKVTRYLYATANVNVPKLFRLSRWPDKMWSERANWAGFVAISDDATTQRLGRRDIAVAWRGTVTHVEWVADLKNYLRPVVPEIPCPDKEVKVEAGFLDMYTDKDETDGGYCRYSAREQVLAEVKRLVEKYKHEDVSVTIIGHSLGSAMATLSAYDVAEMGLRDLGGKSTVHVSVFSFSGPRVGNLRFKERLEKKLGVKVLRVHNAHDMVAKSPGVLVNETSPTWLLKVMEGFPWCYTHVGVDLELDHKKSPFLNPDGDGACAHNLEAHLHLLDGYHGKDREFKLMMGRDLALVNKDCDFLKDDHSVPPKWRQDHNKNMVKTKDGRWVLAERPKPDDHPEYTHQHLTELGLANSSSKS